MAEDAEYVLMDLSEANIDALLGVKEGDGEADGIELITGDFDISTSYPDIFGMVSGSGNPLIGGNPEHSTPGCQTSNPAPNSTQSAETPACFEEVYNKVYWDNSSQSGQGTMIKCEGISIAQLLSVDNYKNFREDKAESFKIEESINCKFSQQNKFFHIKSGDNSFKISVDVPYPGDTWVVLGYLQRQNEPFCNKPVNGCSKHSAAVQESCLKDQVLQSLQQGAVYHGSPGHFYGVSEKLSSSCTLEYKITCPDSCPTSKEIAQMPERGRDLYLHLTLLQAQANGTHSVMARGRFSVWPKTALSLRELNKKERRVCKGGAAQKRQRESLARTEEADDDVAAELQLMEDNGGINRISDFNPVKQQQFIAKLLLKIKAKSRLSKKAATAIVSSTDVALTEIQ